MNFKQLEIAKENLQKMEEAKRNAKVDMDLALKLFQDASKREEKKAEELKRAIEFRNMCWRMFLECRQDYEINVDNVGKAKKEIKIAEGYRDAFIKESKKAYDEFYKEPRRYKMSKQAQQKRRRNKYNKYNK